MCLLLSLLDAVSSSASPGQGPSSLSGFHLFARWGAYGGYQKLVWQQLDRWQTAGTDSRSGFMADAGGLDGSGGGGSGGGSDVTQRPTSQVSQEVRGLRVCDCENTTYAGRSFVP